MCTFYRQSQKKKLLERPELKWQDDKYESGECVRLQTVS